MLHSAWIVAGSDFDMLNKLAANAGWKLLFDFNALLRNGSKWDTTNARAILHYAVQQGYAGNMHLELGNGLYKYNHHVFPSVYVHV